METEKFIESRKVEDYEIWTDEGWVDVQEVHKTVKFDVWVVETENFKLECADEHIVIGENRQEIYVKDLKVGDKIITENGVENVIRVEKLDVEPEHMYDLSIDSENHTFFSNGILSHNSTIATIYMLWTAIFNDDQRILLVANKESTAKEIFKRIRTAYEQLPNWVKSPVQYYGLESLELSNGSRIGITTTTGTAGRGSSANLLFIDEAAFVECVESNTITTFKNKETKKIEEINIKDAHEQFSINKTLNVNDWEILTDDGYKSFKDIMYMGVNDSVKLTFDDNTELICSPEHELLSNSNNFILAKESVYKKIKSINGYKKVISVKKNGKVDLYDVTSVDGSKYITNGILSHNCHLLDDFWASVYPIISSSTKSKVIMASTPKDTTGLFYKLYDGSIKGTNNWAHMVVKWDEIPGRSEKWKRDTIASLGDESVFNREFCCQFDEVGENAIDTELFEKLKRNAIDPLYVFDDGKYLIWNMPEEDRIYVAGVDIAEGVGKDATVVQILDITNPKNIIQVATYHDNKISPVEFTPKLKEILQNWGNPLAFIERNNCGGVVVDNLRKDFNYENIVNWGLDMNVRSKTNKLGIVSHTNTKYSAIMNQRYWINTVQQVQINDKHTVSELNDFVRIRANSWGAKTGSHDDRVMALTWALLALHDSIVFNYFEVEERDRNQKAAVIKSMDYGIKKFINPLSMYMNEKEGGDMMPIIMGEVINPELQDMDDLYSQGWKPLYE